MSFPQLSTPEQQRAWKAQGMEIDPTTGMPYGTVLRNADGNYVVVERSGLRSITEAQADQIIGGFRNSRGVN